MTADWIQELIKNEVFVNGVIAIGCFLVIVRFLAFVKTQWREGLNPHLVPCLECGKRLSKRACFCPGCGLMLQSLPVEGAGFSLKERPLRLGSGQGQRLPRRRRSRQR